MRRFILPLFALFLGTPLTIGSALAADNLFTVKDVPVDATAAASVEAQSIAINEGRPRAWNILYRRLTRQEDWPRQPQLDDLAVQRLVRTFDISDERRSTKRYVAKVTYVFSQPAVERLLRANNISYVASQSRRILVVPLSPTYQQGDSWQLVWSDPRFSSGLVSVVLPDAGDAEALAGVTFDSASWSQLAPIALKARAADAVVAEASSSNGQVTVRLKRLAPGQPMTPSVTAGSQGAAAGAAFAAISDFWKSKSTIDFNQKSRVTADARFTSLSEWAALQTRLGAVQTVTGLDLVAFSINEARVNIAYVGTLEQLRSTLAEAGISMISRAGTWWLSRAEPGGTAP